MRSLASIRSLGLAAAVLLAVVGALGGALPHGNAASTPLTIARDPWGAVILCGWLVGTAVLGYAWWAARDRVPSARWALGTAALWALPFLVVPPMGSRDAYSYACQGYLYMHGLNPYEVGVQTLPCPWLDAVPAIWRDTAAPYGPLFLLISAVAVRLGGDSLVAVVLIVRLVALAGMAAVALGLPALARRCGVPPSRALWIALAGPLVGAHLIAGPHNDALMVGLMVAGLAVAGVRPLLGGVLLGLAVAVKVTAIVVVPFAVLLVIARPYAWRQAAGAGGAVAAGALAALIAVTAYSGLGFGWIGGMVNTRDLVQFTSPPTAIGMTLTYIGQLVTPGFDAVPVIRLLALLLFALLLVAFCWRSATWTAYPPPPSATLPGRCLAWLAEPVSRAADPGAAALRGAAFAMAATVALSPFFHPWYAFWPLALLAATTIRTDLVMAVATAGALLVLPDGSGLARYAKFPGAPIVTVILIALLIQHLRRRRVAVAVPKRVRALTP